MKIFMMKISVMNLALWAVMLCGAHTAVAGIAENVTRAKVAGVDVVAYRTAVKNVITVAGYLPAGNSFAGAGNLSVPELTAMMLDRGTTRRDKFAIAGALENAGAYISFNVGTQALYIEAKLRKQNLALVMNALGEELRVPAFKADEFEKARQQYIGQRQSQSEEVGYRAEEAFLQAIFPAGHPNRAPSLDEALHAARGATLDEVKAFHKAQYGPAHLTLVFVGDIDMRDIKREVHKAFDGWQGGSEIRQAQKAPQLSSGRTEVVKLADKPSVTMILGQPTGLRYTDADALALRVGTTVFGSGFTSRLMKSVRDQEGLTYGIGAAVSRDTFNDGSWAITSTFAPSLLQKGIDSTRRELKRWWSEGVTAEELAARKKNLVGGYEVSLATTQGIAGMIVSTLQRGHALTWLDEYPKAINRLTLEEVNSAIRKHLDPDKMVMTVVGSVEST